MEKDWKDILDPETYYITREKGTERPFSGKYNDHNEEGIYTCVCCNQKLFTSDTKYDPGCGWPSFYDQIDREAIKMKRDTSHGMIRTEIVCSNCDAHLGHVFEDGPQDKTGLRYCVNSRSLNFNQE